MVPPLRDTKIQKEYDFMSTGQTYIGNSLLQFKDKSVTGACVTIDDELFYKIAHYNLMPPFFMSIVSDSDHWMFISSNGALTAGRRNPDHALFPYYTDDKIQDSAEFTGNKTIIFLMQKDKRYLWEPFSFRYEGLYNIERNCYKNVYGNKLFFEEINHDFNISFIYAWLNSEKFGFIKKSKIVNCSSHPIALNLLDGIQNLLPYGVDQRFQMEYSTLVDAYKKNELEPETGLGIYSLSSIPVDKAEPSEAMKATAVWSTGVESETILISSHQLQAFRKGLPLKKESNVRATRGAYLLNTKIDLAPGAVKTWYIVADIDQDNADIVALTKLLKEKRDQVSKIEDDVARGTRNLIKAVANSDGLQKTADTLSTSRHYSNVLFNIMRGGIFNENHLIDIADFIRFLCNANKKVYQQHLILLQNLQQRMTYDDLIQICYQKNDFDLERLCYEYLPLTFSRRHGDPSRPWNRFSIDIKDGQGERILNYQGNWRDIFQNWEALALSFPVFIEGMITKFVNASTADGYNPYRLGRDGFDWEIIDPKDPWSYIGYWGDHQIIYLLKLLELSTKYHPGKLQSLLTEDIFAYANVPYRIKAYAEILVNPHSTVDFDLKQQAEIEKRIFEMGSDGKFICTQTGKIYHVNLAEKLLVPILVKLANFIPEAGIWMNTQRPEWNDANNALVGFGVSMVTLYYLRRHLAFCRDLFRSVKAEFIMFSEEVAVMFFAILKVLENHRYLLSGSISDINRKKMLDQLGTIGSDYRIKIYTKGFSEKKKSVKKEQLVNFYQLAIKYHDHSIRANKREDGLYHAYNLIKVIDNKGISIRYFYEMLEGQVAVLSSGFLSPRESVQVLTALRKSKLYRKDQHSYILYPDRRLPRFMEKNHIPQGWLQKSKLLKTLIASGNRQIVIQDIDGGIHFNGAFRNAMELKQALMKLSQDDLMPLVKKELNLILTIYEDMFDHQSFTGRSGTFFKYEGLGCIYWHMVSKLLLATQETYYRAEEANENDAALSKLRQLYYDIREGIGITKSPQVYGAFPTDPYSHTPAHTGVQQPGMTGQVKEDIISRFGELGVVVHKGKITFHPGLLRKEEFFVNPSIFEYFDSHGKQRSIELDPGCLVFTIAQVPVVYHLSGKEEILVSTRNAKDITIKGLTLNEQVCASIFNRKNEIQRVDVFINPI